MEEENEKCYFAFHDKCKPKKKEGLINVKAKRIENIIKCSKLYNDDIHQKLQSDYDENNDYVLRVHTTCVNKYVHPKDVARALKRQETSGDADTEAVEIKPKRPKRSEIPKFSYLHNCIFCAEECKVEKDKKNPIRWRQAYICRQVESTGQAGSLKEDIINKCNERNDEWAAQVRIRVAGTVSDLHAADARYHLDCRVNFMSQRSISAAVRATHTTTNDSDEALQNVLAFMKKDMSRIWNSVDLYILYTENGGITLSRRLLVTKVAEYFGEDLVVLSSPGIATILAFQGSAAKFLHIVPDAEDDDMEIAISKVKKQICKEVEKFTLDRDNYKNRLNEENVSEYVSNTLLNLLSRLSPKLSNTLPALLVGNIITSIMTNFPTQLQICLAVVLRESKELVKTMSDFGVTCTYDELLRLKKSVAVAAAKNTELTDISSSLEGLIQIVADNFDTDISSQNGKLSTHSLAVLMTQPDMTKQKQEQTIPRIKKTDMKEEIDYNLDILRYNGSKKPKMAPQCLKKEVPSLSVLAHMVVSQHRANENDFAFLVDVVKCDHCPEFNGYNTRLCREQGQSPQPKTKAVYLPLIDMPPADPDTIMTAMDKAQKLTEETGQDFTLFTADQQLYRIVVEVQWAYPNLFPSLVPRLGGMHTLMSFVGAVGTLMAESGIAEILGSVFGGVTKMLTGKKFPMNMRAMRMLTEELLREVIEQNQLNSHQDLMTVLEGLSTRSPTTKMWVDALIKPVLIMMLYVRAEREGDWPLHLQAVKLMMPYFFASGHVNYARYGLYYLRQMEALPANVLAHFMKGSHVMRHLDGLWNGIWSDMFIETTFMRYGHGKTGIIGITLKPETLKTWALSLHVCGQLMQDVSTMRDSGSSVNPKTTHKEEAKGRIAADQLDRRGLRRKLDMCINPLDPTQHPDTIINVVNGRIGPSSVNVDKVIEIGTKQLNEFERKLPEGFYDTIKMEVQTMAVMKKSIKLGENKVFDTNLIYSRVIGLQASSRNVDINSVLTCELSPVPTALFNDSGEMRISKSKSVLKNETRIDISARHKTKDGACTVIDGCALLWIPHWPASSPTKQSMVIDFVDKFKEHIRQRLETSDVYLVFDRYEDYSTKCSTRVARGTEGSRVFQLTLTSPLPSQKLVLTVTENKKQLIDIICRDIQNDTDFLQKHTHKHKLVITGQEGTPIDISCGGVIIQRRDIATTHEEADNIIVQQAIRVAADEQMVVTVLADDTDVYILLLHHYLEQGLEIPMMMESPIKERKVIDIKATVSKHKNIIPALLASHALTGCDTVAACFGVGKGTMLKVLKGTIYLNLLGDVEASWPDVMAQATTFIATCYGQPQSNSMSNVRIAVWIARTGRTSATTTPKLCSLPPTTEAFEENVKRAHLQTCIWRNALKLHPPKLDPTSYGYTKEERTKSLLPTTVPANVQLAPTDILKLIRCTCSSGNPCKSSRCGCNNAKLPCTIFCSCHGSMECCNGQTEITMDEDDDKMDT